MKKFKEINDKNDPKMPLSLKNYILLLAGLIVIILGFVLMAGGGSDSPDEFNYAMFSWRRITLAPILVIGGFIFEIYASNDSESGLLRPPEAGLQPALPRHRNIPENCKMETIQAIILGIVQGLTEFLPVSSSGHLQLAKELLGVDPEVGGLTFDLTLHAATVLSTIVVLWSEIKRLVVGLFSKRFNAEQAYVLKIILSMIPVVIVGFTLEPFLQSLVEDLPNHGILLLVGTMLLVTAVLLTFAYYAKPRHKATISYRDAFIIGLAQAVATLPGLSRSGTTIATGLILGNRKESVAQFSFLMVLAPILGKMVLDLMSGELAAQSIGTAPLLAGFAAAFVVGCLACKFMINIVKRGKLNWFAIYCTLVGGLAIIRYFVIQ